MARVVQRRSNPPYLLILFVFLFVIASAVAVIFYNGRSDQKRLVVAARQKLADFERKGSADPAAEAKLKAMAKAREKTVVDVLEGHVSLLAGKIVGNSEDTPEIAAERAEQAMAARRKAHGVQGRSLLAILDELDEKRREIEVAARNTKQGLEGDKQELDRQLAAIKASRDTAEADRDAARAERDAERARVGVLGQGYNDAIANAKTESDQRLAAKDQTISEAEAREKLLTTNVEQRDAEIRKLHRQIIDLKGGSDKSQGIDVAKVPDGKILRVSGEDNVAWISIGSTSRVYVGLPFSVYAARAGIPGDYVGKGKLVVTNVDKSIAECRIVESEKDDPLRAGDVIANGAFDVNRVYTFVVEGEFDIDGDAIAEANGNQRIRAMIAKYGGKVLDAFSPDVDFVVIGAQPAVPIKPALGSPAPLLSAWEAQSLKVKHYNGVSAKAADLQIPVLNATRFLAFVGYSPAEGS